MKLFTFIFSIYLLLLTAVPCCAFDNCEDDTVSTTENTRKENMPEKEKGCNNCSPFFSCHCCTGFIIQDRFSINEIVPVYNSKRFSPNILNYLQDYTSLYWHPPRIS